MIAIDDLLFDLRRLDRLAAGRTPLHRLDPRAKVLTVLTFTICVVSLDRYAISALVPYFLFPVVLVAMGGLPPGYFLRKLLVVLPFALFVGLFNPIFDRPLLLQIGPLGVSGGWVSCASIVLRSLLTVSTALILVGVTGFTGICRALEQFGMPRVFAVQLLFLNRYIFVLGDEAARTARARELRTSGGRGRGIVPFSRLVGHLLLRTWQRAERLHMAMLARGFTGEFRTVAGGRLGSGELLFVLGWAAFFLLARLVNLPHLIGAIVTGGP